MKGVKYLRYDADKGSWKLTCNRQVLEDGQGLDSAIECEKRLIAQGDKYRFVWINKWW